jgi:nucleoside-diphosphate-sugar epimerase
MEIQELVMLTCSIIFVLWVFQPCAPTKPYLPTTCAIDVDDCKAKWTRAMSTNCPKTGDQYLIIGGGFLGSRLIHALLASGETHITVFDLSATISWASDPRVKFIHGDLTNLQVVTLACTNITTVFNTAAIVRFMDDLPFQWKTSYAVNVQGVRNVIQACVEQQVTFLLQTSSLHANVSKQYDATRSALTEDIKCVTAETSLSHYATTKAMGEQLVREANSTGLKTVILRPCGIFGCGDQLMLDKMLQQKIYVFLGYRMFMDFVYVDNIAYAHFLAETALREQGQVVSSGTSVLRNQRRTHEQQRGETHDGPLRSEYQILPCCATSAASTSQGRLLASAAAGREDALSGGFRFFDSRDVVHVEYELCGGSL